MQRFPLPDPGHSLFTEEGMTQFGSLCIVVNRSKAGADAVAETLLSVANELSVAARLECTYPVPPGSLDNSDLCCVIGGDGSILGIASEAQRSRTPVMGINCGKLGFMATSSPDDAAQTLKSILHGAFSSSERMMLLCETAQGTVHSTLNDIVIKSAEGNRLINLKVFSEEKLITTYYCDGLIFSTPTGSTAYNLSAGGPLIDPEADNYAMTPVCPHTLSNRSVVFGKDVELTVTLDQSGVLPQVTIDGHTREGADELFPLKNSSDPRRFILIHDDEYSAFDVVRNKLGWAR